MDEWHHETLLLGGWRLPKNPTKVTLYPCLLRDRAWYCIRGLRPMSPKTSAQTRRAAPPSRRRSLHSMSGTSAVKTAAHTAGHVPSDPVRHKNRKGNATSTRTVQKTEPVPRVAMFVCDDVSEWRGRNFRFKVNADLWGVQIRWKRLLLQTQE